MLVVTVGDRLTRRSIYEPHTLIAQMISEKTDILGSIKCLADSSTLNWPVVLSSSLPCLLCLSIYRIDRIGRIYISIDPSICHVCRLYLRAVGVGMKPLLATSCDISINPNCVPPGARWNSGVVSRFPSYKFESKAWTNVRFYFK